jgi:hypothetical protein
MLLDKSTLPNKMPRERDPIFKFDATYDTAKLYFMRDVYANKYALKLHIRQQIALPLS